MFFFFLPWGNFRRFHTFLCSCILFRSVGGADMIFTLVVLAFGFIWSDISGYISGCEHGFGVVVMVNGRYMCSFVFRFEGRNS